VRVCAESARLKVPWNVQMRGEFVSAETKWFTRFGDDSVVYLQILRGLARSGVAAIIDSDPRELYHREARLSMGKYYENWKAELREKNAPFPETRAKDAAPTPNTREQSSRRKGVPRQPHLLDRKNTRCHLTSPFYPLEVLILSIYMILAMMAA